MQAYADILNYAIPFFIVLILIEYAVSRYMSRTVIRFFDTISSLSSGITNVVKDILGLSIIIISYTFLYDHLAILDIRSSLLVYLVTFVGLDFAGYWSHRINHSVNLFWNRHVIHHSSEEYNLACALRQSISEVFAIYTLLYLPLAILGIKPEVIAIVAPIHLFAQFWYHTRLIDKMGVFEYILVTPSHHRVHHAVNPQYIDKNFSQIFIVWDKLFGTFQPEIPEEVPIYGITKQVNTWNPWIINFQHLWRLALDALYTKSWSDKLKVWFMPTGWRPADRRNINEHESDIYNRPKYSSKSSLAMNYFVVFELLSVLCLMLYFFSIIGTLDIYQLLLNGLLIFITIFSYTSLMDGSIIAIPATFVKFALGVTIFYLEGYSWFEIERNISFGNMLVLSYLTLSTLGTLYFYYYDKPVSTTFNEHLPQRSKLVHTV